MLAVMIVGLAISGVMLLMGSGTTANAYGNKLASAVLLADEARALTDGAAFDDLLDFDGTTFTPTDALDNPIASLADYEQALSVTYINPDDFTDYAGTDPPVLARLTAAVTHNGDELIQITWLRSR